MNAGSWRKWALAVTGAMLLMLTGVGLWRQHVLDTDGFTIIALVQGAFYLAAVALTRRGGLARNCCCCPPDYCWSAKWPGLPLNATVT